MKKIISIIIPVYNEEKNIQFVYNQLQAVCSKLSNYDYEYIFVNDGSMDKSGEIISGLVKSDKNVKYVEFSRNFGKEMATTAGIKESRGHAVIMIDADLQHPPEIIPEFISRWESGSEVVVGVRVANKGEGFIKSIGSNIFYSLMNMISDTAMVSGETDFRLIDRVVADAFVSLSERERMTRSLINWLGFRREFIRFQAPARLHGITQYSTAKLFHLAIYSFITNSLKPLRMAGYIGIAITFVSGLLGLIVIINKYTLGDPLAWNITGSAQLAILNVFLVGIVLMVLGIMSLYIGNIDNEVGGRPLYVVRKRMNF